MLFITSAERQKFDPAQDMQANLGKIIRIKDDGDRSIVNPFADKGGITAQIWSLGHRNPLGILFDDAGSLWVHEMGPMGGDELNLIEKGANYSFQDKDFGCVIGRGWPTVFQGVSRKRPIPSLLPCEMNFLKVYILAFRGLTKAEFRARITAWVESTVWEYPITTV
jgi:hypothetical protein